MSIEYVRVSAKAREQLSRLKRHTGIENWNVLCRWALCVSLSESTVPPPIEEILDGGVEMAWKTFGGNYDQIYLALLRERCRQDGFDTKDDSVVAEQFRLHLHRGIGYLAGDRSLRHITDLISRAA